MKSVYNVVVPAVTHFTQTENQSMKMKGINSVESARRRVANLAKALGQCGTQMNLYGQCVSKKTTVQQNDCAKEFLALKDCVSQAMKKL